MDGEKDPRCLLASFSCVRLAAAAYQQPDVDAAPLEMGAEELVDVLAAYFPVSFKPPPNDQHRITRQDLAAELEKTLTCCPAFAPHVMPLMFE